METNTDKKLLPLSGEEYFWIVQNNKYFDDATLAILTKYHTKKEPLPEKLRLHFQGIFTNHFNLD